MNMPSVVLGPTNRVPNSAFPEYEVQNLLSIFVAWLCGDYCIADLRFLETELQVERVELGEQTVQ
jgi:hypothetical protein